MSLSARTSWLVLAVLALGRPAAAQFVTDQTLLSGSGLTVMPTATTLPSTELRLHGTRMSFLGGGLSGINIVGLTAGLSSKLEGYLRLSGEQTGDLSSHVAFGFGAKLHYPERLPVIGQLALWAEATSTDQSLASTLFPGDAFRTGFVATLDSNGVHPTFLLGMSRVNERTAPLVGAGFTVAGGSALQAGFEAVHGYLGVNSLQLSASVSARVFSNVTVQFSPGYLSSGGVRTATIAFGIAIATAAIDFHPAPPVQQQDEFILPSIEEIEKQQNKPSGGGPGADGSAGKPDPQQQENNQHE
jgi:hypothetical protein